MQKNHTSGMKAMKVQKRATKLTQCKTSEPRKI